MANRTSILRASLAILCVSLILAAYWVGRRGGPSADHAAPPAISAAPRQPAAPGPAGAGIRHVESTDAEPPTAAHPPRAIPTSSNAPWHLAFRETQRCFFLAARIAVLKRMADCSPMNGRAGLELQYAACLNGVVDHQDQIRSARAAMATCGDEKTLVRRYFDATKSAAKNGDVEAQLCYVSGQFTDPDGTTHYTDEDLAEYRATAPGYVDAALQRGDWHMVAVLSRHFVDGFELSRLLDGIGEPETIYKMDALMRLGAVGDYADTLNSSMQDIAHPDQKPELGLSPAGVAAAEDWARSSYARSFSGSPPLTAAPARCGADNDAED
jgi:hypothetical protein